MAYPVIPSRRIPYDIDGTAVGFTSSISDATETSILSYPIVGWFSSTQLANSNNPHYYANLMGVDSTDGRGFWYFFTELKEITHWVFKLPEDEDRSPQDYLVQGSIDSTNGQDGTWETGIYSIAYSKNPHTARGTGLMTISFSSPIKVLRIGLEAYYSFDISGFLLYGSKYYTETPEDILFVDASTGVELTSLMEWGDRPEGTTQFRQVKIKNASSSKTANNINLQLNHTDFVMSWSSGGPWTTVLDITSLGAGAESSAIYLKNELGQPPLILGPKMDARIIATLGSWT